MHYPLPGQHVQKARCRGYGKNHARKHPFTEEELPLLRARVGEEIEIIEALWKTVIRPITAYEGEKAKLLVCRKPEGIDDEQKEEAEA